MNDLIIDKSIFGEAALIQAIGAYASLCEISVRENVNQYICHFDKCKYGEERTQREFENYLISIINTRG